VRSGKQLWDEASDIAVKDACESVDCGEPAAGRVQACVPGFAENPADAHRILVMA
jgi:hypothetical protein